MNTLVPFVVVLAALTAGCSKPSPEVAPPPAKPVVYWFRNDQGFIRSGVKTNDNWAPTSTNGYKEVQDPLEGAPEFAEAFRHADTQAEFATEYLAGQLGRAHMFWKKKKELLRERHQIDWKSPEELNPMTTYD